MSSQLRDDESGPIVLDTVIRHANTVAAAAELQHYKRTLKQKYGADPSGLASHT